MTTINLDDLLNALRDPDHPLHKRVKQHIEEAFAQEREEVAKEIFEEIEAMYPELRGVYWRGKSWLDFKAQYLKGGA